MTGSSSALTFHALGPVEVRRSGRALPLGSAKERTLLAALILNANASVPRERLLDALWSGTPPKSAAKIVQVYVSRLRHMLGETGVRSETLRTDGTGYRLCVDPDRIDVKRFQKLVRRAQTAAEEADAQTAARLFTEALALWQGPALADIVDEPFARREHLRLEALRLEALERKFDAELALGRSVELISELATLVADHPLRERLRAQFMRALYRAGRQAEALAVYQEGRADLRAELGLEPGPALRELERAILAHDPSLVGPGDALSETDCGTLRTNVVTLYADLTGRLDELEADVLAVVLARWAEIAADVIGRHHGTPFSLVDGSVAAVFGLQARTEDDALRALQAALAVLEEAASAAGFEARAAVASGDLLMVTDRPAPFVGGGITLAAQLAHAAGIGEIVASNAIAEELENAAVWMPLRPDRGNGVEGWRFEAFVQQRRPVTPEGAFVGRARELGRLERLVGERGRAGGCDSVGIVGEPGIGKSRLAWELGRRTGDAARMLVGSCRASDGSTFLALAEAIEQALGSIDAEALAGALEGDPEARVIAMRAAGALGDGEASGRDETFWALRRLLQALARERPLLLVLDDAHRAEPMLLEFISHLHENVRDGAILVLLLARTEPDLELPGSTIELRPLSRRESERLLEQRTLSPVRVRLRERVLRLAEGNPLFLEQLLSHAAEQGSRAGALPATLDALLTARLDALPELDRVLLGTAAVIGREFSLEPLAALASESKQLLAARLAELTQRRFLRVGRAEVYSFHHGLLRDTAYRMLRTKTRADLHERFATWLERRFGTSAERAYIAGSHLERAHEYRLELGSPEAETRELGIRAAEKLSVAASRALVRSDMPFAVDLLTRSVALLPKRDRRRTELLLELTQALREVGDYERARATMEEAREHATRANDRGLLACAALAHLQLRIQADPEISPDEVVAGAEDAVRVLEETGHQEWAAKAWYVRALAPWFRSQAEDAQQALEQAIAIAHRVGAVRTETQALVLMFGVVFSGPLPVPDGIRRCEENLATRGRERRISASTMRALGLLRAMSGEFDEARRLLARDRAIMTDLGLLPAVGIASYARGFVELLADDALAAERELRAGYESLRRFGDTCQTAIVSALLAEALYRQDRHDEALAWSQTSEGDTGVADNDAQSTSKAVRAKVLVQRGNFTEAEALAREAVAITDETDFLNARADARMDLAEVLAGEDPAQAQPVLEEAIDLYKRKKNTVSLARAREREQALLLAAPTL